MFAEAVDEITQADIPHATRTNALRLLRHAHPDNGHVAITWQDASAVCGVSLGTLRRQLGQMAAAHLIHYSSNGDGYVYCTFKAWIRREPSKNSTVDARGRAGTGEKFDSNQPADEGHDAPDAREPSKNSTVDARGRAVDARSLTRASAGDLEGRKEGRNTDPTNFLPSFPTPTRTEADRSLKLLRDDRVNLWIRHANRLAGLFPFEYIRDHVAAWYMNRKEVGGPLKNGSGIVYVWLLEPGKAVRNGYEPAEWRKTDLYKDHRTPDEVAAGDSGDDDQEARRRKYIPDEFSDIAIG